MKAAIEAEEVAEETEEKKAPVSSFFMPRPKVTVVHPRMPLPIPLPGRHPAPSHHDHRVHIGHGQFEEGGYP